MDSQPEPAFQICWDLCYFKYLLLFLPHKYSLLFRHDDLFLGEKARYLRAYSLGYLMVANSPSYIERLSGDRAQTMSTE